MTMFGRIFISTGWIAINVCTDINGLQGMKHTHFNEASGAITWFAESIVIFKDSHALRWY